MSDALRTNQAAVATHHPFATQTARRILQNGGNATDAAVAAMATLCVIVPGSVGIGGYGGCMIAYDAATKRTHALEFNTRAPLQFRPELYACDPKPKSMFGYLAISVPAIISGLAKALKDLGTKTWAEVTQPAIEFAENGFEVDAHNRCVLEMWLKTADDLSKKAHFKNGHIPNVGDRWVQCDLAKTLRTIAKDGPESFYQGELPQRIVKQIRAHGGILSEKDFAQYEARAVEPISLDYRGYKVLGLPPTSGTITTFQLLQTLEQFDVGSFEPWSAPYLHVVAEICKSIWPDRDKLGDPGFVPVPYHELLNPTLASSRATQIRQRDIATGVEAKIDDMPHTCNVAVTDRCGNFVSITATQGAQFGSGVCIEGTGIVLGHGMARFEYNNPTHPNRPAPGKRPVHNMVPALLFKDDKCIAAMGLPGGTRIPTVTAQLVVSLVDFQATAEQAVHATRVHCEGPEPLIISKDITKQTASELEAMGHTLKYGEHALGTAVMLGGPANVVRIDDEGQLDAASNASHDAGEVLNS